MPRQQPGACTRHRAVDGGQQAATNLARQGAGQFQIAPGGGVNRHGLPARDLVRRRQARQAADLGHLQIFHQGAAGGQFGSAEVAKGVQGGNLIQRGQAPLTGARVKPCGGIGGDPLGPIMAPFSLGNLRQHAIREHQFAGRQPRQLRPDGFFLDLRGQEFAGG